MEQLPIVRKRTNVWPILIAVLLLGLVLAAVFLMMGDQAVTDVSEAVSRLAG